MLPPLVKLSFGRLLFSLRLRKIYQHNLENASPCLASTPTPCRCKPYVLGMTTDRDTPDGASIGPNPHHPSRMTPAERRAELCALLARGLVRLKRGGEGDTVGDPGDIRLHYPADRCRHAPPIREEDA